MSDRNDHPARPCCQPPAARPRRRGAARWLAAAALPVAGLAAASCGGPAPRFALRAPVTREAERPFARRPDRTNDLNAPHAADQSVMGPISRALTFRAAGEALNVNALDEVPDSSWFTNRGRVSPELAAQGPCRDAPPPTAPFTVSSGKIGGMTPGLFARDALGRRFALKLDLFPRDQPELSTAADAIVSRLYWLIGYNVPCNSIVDVRPDADLRIVPDSYVTNEFGHRIRLTRDRMIEQIGRGVPRPGGAVRMGASLFVEGEPIGPFPVEGRRGDDPNDRIAHEERRELRGERLLAAWVNHWDSREPNALDTFVRVNAAPPGGASARGGGPAGAASLGLVRHYIIDFGDSLGGRNLDLARDRRLGTAHTVEPGTMLVDLATFGAVRRPWDDAAPNAATPIVWNFEATRFDPGAWVPGTPMPRFQRATDADMGWMARRIARVTPAHLSALVRAGQLHDVAVERELLRALVARRERILRWAFARSSPLDALAMVDHDRLCAQDLGLASGVSDPGRTAFTARLARRGDHESGAGGPALALMRGVGAGELCATLPPHGAYPAGTPDDAAARYVTIEIARVEGRARTRLRAHLYDLGPERGYALVGIER